MLAAGHDATVMPADLLDRLRALPHAAAALEAVAPEPGVHVVGGAVRDVLLGREPVEIDLVVEGDAADVARRVAARLGGEARLHERFGTATLRAAGTTFDLASARRERYPRPGALPEVEPGATLAEDLGRRDFTINAIAVSAHDGHVTAHPRALEDVAARRLAILHSRSFQDDPTRLLRLCRYGARLSLGIDAETRAQAAAAVAQGCLETVSGKRLGRELRLLAREPQPAALSALGEHGLGGRVLHPAFAVDADLIERVRALCPADARADLAGLASTLTGVPAPALAGRLDQLGFERGERERVVAAATRADRVAATLGSARGAQRWEMLEREAPETVALAGALTDDPDVRQAARRWLEDLRHRDTLLTGHDLQAAGLSGSEVGRGLRAARAAVRESSASGIADQLAAALAAARDP